MKNKMESWMSFFSGLPIEDESRAFELYCKKYPKINKQTLAKLVDEELNLNKFINKLN